MVSTLIKTIQVHRYRRQLRRTSDMQRISEAQPKKQSVTSNNLSGDSKIEASFEKSGSRCIVCSQVGLVSIARVASSRSWLPDIEMNRVAISDV